MLFRSWQIATMPHLASEGGACMEKAINGGSDMLLRPSLLAAALEASRNKRPASTVFLSRLRHRLSNSLLLKLLVELGSIFDRSCLKQCSKIVELMFLFVSLGPGTPFLFCHCEAPHPDPCRSPVIPQKDCPCQPRRSDTKYLDRLKHSSCGAESCCRTIPIGLFVQGFL